VNPPDANANFSALPLAPPLHRAIETLGFRQMTPIQASALPAMLQGRDVVGQAQTGSGKTVAFGLAALMQVQVSTTMTQVLVLCPTRELADQVASEFRKLGRFLANLRVITLCGGVPVRSQKRGLEIAPHVIVATPGRILDHLQRDNVDFSALKVVVLDEADRMLDMGFHADIATVVASVPKARQTLLFSATYPEDIRALSQNLQHEPIDISLATKERASTIEQSFYAVDAVTKLDALVAVLLEPECESALIFCRTRAETRALCEDLLARGFSALALQGEMEQRQRDEVLVRFANGSARVLVATDVAARGLDLSELDLVIEWELADDPHVHVHRTGRTGRAGRKGRSIALCTPRDRRALSAIESFHGTSIRLLPPPLAVNRKPSAPAMTTLVFDAGRQDKLRPGDLLGALTGEMGLNAQDVGKIVITPRLSYVAIARSRAVSVLQGLKQGKIKGRTFRVRRLA
jgi:ATP-independent RNA helicase DbpA